MAVGAVAGRAHAVPCGRMILRASHTREAHFGGQAVGMCLVFDLLGHDVTLVALEGTTVRSSAQMSLVRADAKRRDLGVAERVERRSRVLVAAVADLAITRGVVDDAIHVAFGGDEMPVRVDHLRMAGVTAIGLRMRSLRRQAVASAARGAASAWFGPNRPCFAMAIATLTGARGSVVAGLQPACFGEDTERDVSGRSIIGVAGGVDGARNHVTLVAR